MYSLLGPIISVLGAGVAVGVCFYLQRPSRWLVLLALHRYVGYKRPYSLKFLAAKTIVYDGVKYDQNIPQECKVLLERLKKFKGKEREGMLKAIQSGDRRLITFYLLKLYERSFWTYLRAVFCMRDNVTFSYIVETCLTQAAYKGDQNLVDLFVRLDARDWDGAMMYAAEGGHRRLVKFFIDKGANNWPDGAYFAARGGNLRLVKFFLRKLPVHHFCEHYILEGAIEGASKRSVNKAIEIIDYLSKALDITDDDFNDHGLQCATECNNEELIRYFKEKLGQAQ